MNFPNDGAEGGGERFIFVPPNLPNPINIVHRTFSHNGVARVCDCPKFNIPKTNKTHPRPPNSEDFSAHSIIRRTSCIYIYISQTIFIVVNACRCHGYSGSPSYYPLKIATTRKYAIGDVPFTPPPFSRVPTGVDHVLTKRRFFTKYFHQKANNFPSVGFNCLDNTRPCCQKIFQKIIPKKKKKAIKS